MNKLKTIIFYIGIIWTWLIQLYLLLFIYEDGRSLLSLLFNSKYQKDFFKSEAMRLDNQSLTMVAIGYIAMLLATIALIFVLGYIRSLLKNINKNVFFATSNMKTLKKLSISTALLTIASYIKNYIRSSAFDFRDIHYTSSWNYPFYFLVILLLVYYIFKKGLQLQEEANKII